MDELTGENPRPTLVTGGTGLLGSHIAERLVAAGRPVRALARPGADASFLESLGVEVVRGDLTDPGACRRAVAGVDAIYHAAAKVGDWGPWREFRAGCVEATARLATAAADAGVRRFLHISSTSAYGHPADRDEPVTELEPMGQRVWPVDPYTRSKVESEQALGRVARGRNLAATVIRPSWLYGERDRTTAPRLIARLRAGKVPLIGRGDNPLSAVYAGNVADAAILAADDPDSAGEAYNVTNQGRITQAEFLNLFARACRAPAVDWTTYYPGVFAVAIGFEAAYRLARSRRPPPITRYATWLLGRRLEYSTAKIEARLGWRPALDYPESIGRTVRWHLPAAEPEPETVRSEP